MIGQLPQIFEFKRFPYVEFDMSVLGLRGERVPKAISFPVSRARTEDRGLFGSPRRN